MRYLLWQKMGLDNDDLYIDRIYRFLSHKRFISDIYSRLDALELCSEDPTERTGHRLRHIYSSAIDY